MKNYTLRDIAKLANVSFKTVSRVVNNETGVKKETREKVMKILKETNYTMNYYAKGLSQNKTFQILVVSDIDRDQYPAQRTSIMINSIISEAKKRNYKIVLVNNMDELESEFMGGVERGYYDGMIVFNSPRNNELLSNIEKLGVHVVVSGKNNEITCVGTDYEAGTFMAVTHLLEAGVQNVNLLLDDLNWPTHIEKIKGFKKALAAHSKTFREEDIVSGLITGEAVYNYVEQGFLKGSLPEGIIIYSDFAALGAIKAINKHRIPCPDRLSVISFGNMPICQEVYPELSAVNQDFKRIGELLVEKLLLKIDGQDTDSYKIKTKLIVRDSSL